MTDIHLVRETLPPPPTFEMVLPETLAAKVLPACVASALMLMRPSPVDAVCSTSWPR